MKTIRLYVFPFIPVAIIAALAILGDRAMGYWLIQKEAALMVVIVCVLAALAFVLLIYLQQKFKNRKGGAKNPDE